MDEPGKAVIADILDHQEKNLTAAQPGSALAGFSFNHHPYGICGSSFAPIQAAT
jgi:hypothetical protein